MDEGSGCIRVNCCAVSRRRGLLPRAAAAAPTWMVMLILACVECGFEKKSLPWPNEARSG